jgi:hypothetical protein
VAENAQRGVTVVVSVSAEVGFLAEVVELALEKGLVIDAYVRVSLVGIEVLTIDARVGVASVDTYLRFAEAVNRLDLGVNASVTGQTQHRTASRAVSAAHALRSSRSGNQPTP